MCVCVCVCVCVVVSFMLTLIHSKYRAITGNSIRLRFQRQQKQTLSRYTRRHLSHIQPADWACAIRPEVGVTKCVSYSTPKGQLHPERKREREREKAHLFELTDSVTCYRFRYNLSRISNLFNVPNRCESLCVERERTEDTADNTRS